MTNVYRTDMHGNMYLTHVEDGHIIHAGIEAPSDDELTYYFKQDQRNMRQLDMLDKVLSCLMWLVAVAMLIFVIATYNS